MPDETTAPAAQLRFVKEADATTVFAYRMLRGLLSE